MSEAGDEAADYAYDDEQEEAPSVTGQELMELDGKLGFIFKRQRQKRAEH